MAVPQPKTSTESTPPPGAPASAGGFLDDGFDGVVRPVVGETRPLFLLAYNPLGWRPELVGKVDRWLPEIVEIPLVPGANGMVTRMRDEDPAAVFAQAEDYIRRERRMIPLSRRLIVPASCLPAGVAEGPWLRRVEVRCQGQNAWTYLTPWHRAVAGLPGDPIDYKLDAAGWLAFRAWLVDQKHVVPDATFEAVKAAYMRRVEARLKYRQNRAYPVPEVGARRRDEAQADIEAAKNATAPAIA